MNKDLPTINLKSAETKSLNGVTYPCKVGESISLIQVAINMVSRKSLKNEFFGQFVQSSN